MKLVLPTVEYKDSFIEAVKEFQADPDYTHRNRDYRALVIFELESDFESYIEREKGKAEGKNLKEGYVPQSEFWLVDGGEYIGRASVRHSLTDHLLKIGGHIGYDVRPSKRGQGYGNKILELALQKARELGITHVLVTSDIRNVASRKIIEKNGGVLENQIFNPEMGHDALRFWIDIP